MSIKNLTAAITPNLVLEVGPKTYEVKPPSRDDGVLMLAIHRAAVAAFAAATDVCATCGRTGPAELSEDDRALLEANGSRALGEMSLGDQYETILADWDAKTVEKLELYASYYWVFGEAYADEWWEVMNGGGAAVPPKDQAASKNGRNMGSGNQSKPQTGRSTPATESRKKSRSKSGPSKTMGARE